jgi:hypothetical protein
VWYILFDIDNTCTCTCKLLKYMYIEVNAIGCWHAVAETGLNSSSTLFVAVSTQDLQL